MTYIAIENWDGHPCESCERALATFGAVDEDRAYWVCERCVPQEARVGIRAVPAQAGS